MTNEEIVMLIKNGTEVKKNMEILYVKNRGLIKKFAASYRGYAEEEDLLQEGYIGLYDAVLRYNPAAGCKFISYAGIWIKQAMLIYIAQKGTMIKIPTNLYWQCKKYNGIIQKYIKNNYGKSVNEKVLEELGVTDTEFELIKQANYVLEGCRKGWQAKEEGETELWDTIAGKTNMEQEVIENIINKEVAVVLWKQVNQLDMLQATIIEMRYKRKMTIREVADSAGISISTVREIEKRALMALRQNKTIKNLIGFEEKKSTNYYKGVGATIYKYTGTSSTEYEAMKMYKA